MRALLFGALVVSWTPRVPAVSAFALTYPRLGRQCLKCHEKTTPEVVSEWRESLHSEAGVGCVGCHGANVHCAQCHVGGDEVRVVSPATCGECHPDRLKEFREGSHAVAWTAMTEMPGAHAWGTDPDGSKEDCRPCHAIGLKSEPAIKDLRGSGTSAPSASCDACHGRHRFSVTAARGPEACRPCHDGSDQLQWKALAASAHGRADGRASPPGSKEGSAGPSCQSCHMVDARHGVRSSWGGLGLRASVAISPEDIEWRLDRAAIRRVLGSFALESAEGTGPVREGAGQRLGDVPWREARERRLGACLRCHPETLAREALQKADELLKASDHLLAEASRLVEGLRGDGLFDGSGPDTEGAKLLSVPSETRRPLERKLLQMYQERIRFLQWAAHGHGGALADKALESLQKSLVEMKALAAELGEARRQRP